MDMSCQPLYKKVASDIVTKIQSGEFPKGSMIMSEASFQKEYGISRVTVRKAFKMLIDEGVLRTIQGKGTFVSDVDTKDWTWMKSFSREVLESGHVPTTKIISFKTIFADRVVASHLQVTEGEQCYYLKRIRYIDNKPVWLTKSYIPCHLVEGLNEDYFSVAGVAQSIFRVIELNFGVKVLNGEEIQEAIIIQEKDAKYLNIQINKPVISKAFVAFGEGGKPVVYENTVFEQTISKVNL